jgi:dolichol kinase
METPAFHDLVEQTAGAQPWRRVFHALNGSVIAAALTFLPLSRGLALWILGVGLVALITLDVVRLRFPTANALFFARFRRLVSPREARGFASSTWYTLGALLTVAIFPRQVAVSGILVLAFADPLASYLGRRWGRRPFLGGSLEGTAVFALTAFLILGLRHPLPAAAGAALACALTERLPWRLDDNLTVPLVGATAVTLLEALL